MSSEESYGKSSTNLGNIGFWISLILIFAVIIIYVLHLTHTDDIDDNGPKWNIVNIEKDSSSTPNGQDILISTANTLAINNPKETDSVGTIFKVINASVTSMEITAGVDASFPVGNSITVGPGKTAEFLWLTFDGELAHINYV
jgi:hypothetical protein